MTTDAEDEQPRPASPNHPAAISNQNHKKSAEYRLIPESKVMGKVTG